MATNVSYRHMEIPNERGPNAHGFAMWYSGESEASQFFNLVQEYFESNRDGNIAITLSKGDGIKGSVCVSASVSSKTFMCEINDVEVHWIDSLLNCLDELPYIFVAAGFTDADGKDHLLPNCHYCSSIVSVDGEFVMGKSGEYAYPKLDW